MEKLIVRSIGLIEEYIQSLSSSYYFSTESFIRSFIKPRPKFLHKGRAGRNLLVAGGIGKMGAALLASRSCLRSGAGLLTVHTPSCGLEVLQIGVPEAMISIDENEAMISKVEKLR